MLFNSACSFLCPSRSEVGFSLGCEVMFMNVCAEGRNTASTDWMSHHSSLRPLEMTRPWRQSGIHGNSAGHFVIFLYYSYYYRVHPGDISEPIRRELTLVLVVFNYLNIIWSLWKKKKQCVICTTEPYVEICLSSSLPCRNLQHLKVCHHCCENNIGNLLVWFLNFYIYKPWRKLRRLIKHC